VLAALLVLVRPDLAGAHPALSPASLEVDAETRIVVQIPNERLGHATIRLTLSFPRGFTIVRADAAGPWAPTVRKREVTWTGGRLTGEEGVDFPITLRANVPAGTYDVSLDQRYEDGGRVPTTAPLTVLPALGENAPEEHYGRAIAAAVGGLVIVAGSLLILHLLRRGGRSA
jgi:uncharacterized protein YcnI